MNAINGTRYLATPVMHAQPVSPDFALLDGLPYRCALELAADKIAPSAARKWLANLLGEWSLSQFEDAVTLIASELLTNSITEIGKLIWAAGPPPVRLGLHGGPELVALQVSDMISAAPMPRRAADDEESGRGLFLVGQYSDDWGFYYDEESGGKVTWAFIRTP